MKLSDEIKQAIISEYQSFKEDMYKGKSKEERSKLDQYFTPPEYTIKMIEKISGDSLTNKTILDPTCGSGNLLIACLIAGADPNNLYGNDYDEEMVGLCKSRINSYIKNVLNQSSENFNIDTHIHWGNALQKLCLYEFNGDYKNNYEKQVRKFPGLIDDMNFAQTSFNVPNKYLYEDISLWET